MPHCRPDTSSSGEQLLGVLESWVEQGRRPEAIRIDLQGAASSAANGRPLCPLPQVPRRVGDGAYACVEPR